MAAWVPLGLLSAASCAPGSRINISQPLALGAGPRVLGLPDGQDSDAPALRLPAADLKRAVQAAGFTLDPAIRPTYRLYLSASAAPFRTGSVAGTGQKGKMPTWITPPDRRVAVRIAGSPIVHVTAALVDIRSGALVWRGTAYRPAGRDPEAIAHSLTLALLDRLPHA